MKPYYEDAAVTIYHGDAREFAALIHDADVFVTDPPYGVEGGRGGQARERGKARYDAGAWEDTPAYIDAVIVPIIRDAIFWAQRGAVTPGVRCLTLYPEAADMGGFFTPASVGVGPWGFQTIHPILYYGRDYRAGIGALPTGRILTEPAERNGHPCPKPIGAWRWLIEKVSQPTELIIDPFMGSGTTLRAAKDCGRRAVGIEIDERWCEIAAKRMAQGVLL